MQKKDPMYVVYMTQEALDAHKKNPKDLTKSLFEDKSVEAKVSPLKPDSIIATTLADIKSLPKGSKPILNYPHPFISSTSVLELLALQGVQQPGDSIPSILVFANGNAPGGNRLGGGQEENLLQNSDLGYGMPHTYPQDDIWKGLGGIYSVLCHTLEGHAFWAIINPAPNLNDYSLFFTVDPNTITTPGEVKLFGFDPSKKNSPEAQQRFMRHLLGEVLMQFLMVKSLNSLVFMTGLFGCGRFSGDPEYYAAAVKFVSELPTFKDIRLAYALGQDYESLYSSRMTHKIFKEPNDTLLALANSIFTEHFGELCSADSCEALLKTSQAVQNYYCVELPKQKQSEISAAVAPVGFWSGITNWFYGGTSTEATTPGNQPKSP